jgi:hypothetical protein
LSKRPTFKAPPPPEPIATSATATVATTVADSNDSRGGGEDETDIITGQQKLSPDEKQSGKTLFGVIVPGSRNGTEEGRKKGLTHAEVLADQEARVRRHSSQTTSSSSTPKNSPKVKKHKLKITTHFRNSELTE